MLTLLSMLTAGLLWIGTHAWVLLLALLPAVLNFFAPVTSVVTDGIKGFASTVWEGLKSMDFKEWMVVLTVGTVTAGIGYHFGWQHCLDWAHAHFRFVAKMPVSHWWKFW